MYFKIHLNIKLMSQLYPKNVYQYQQRMDDITGPLLHSLKILKQFFSYSSIC